MLKQIISGVCLVLLLAAGAAQADEAKVKQAVEAAIGEKVEGVRKANVLGLYELRIGGDILYADEKANYLITGNIIDLKTRQNLTQERLIKLSAIKFSDLPLDRAFKQVRGDGKRVLATFEDPNCGYCKRLAKELTKLDNITVYTFLVPILSEDSFKKSKQIWCASDRAKAWNDWMVENKAPEGKDDCDTTAIANNMAYAKKLKINGTPTLVFADGERIPGAIPLDRIEAKLQALSK